jgi:hypothetical protein
MSSVGCSRVRCGSSWVTPPAGRVPEAGGVETLRCRCPLCDGDRDRGRHVQVRRRGRRDAHVTSSMARGRHPLRPGQPVRHPARPGRFRRRSLRPARRSRARDVPRRRHVRGRVLIGSQVDIPSRRPGAFGLGVVVFMVGNAIVARHGSDDRRFQNHRGSTARDLAATLRLCA